MNKKTDSQINNFKKLEKKIDGVVNSVDRLAQITAKGFMDMEEKFDKKIEVLDEKFSQKFDNLSNRIDDLAMNRATREQVKIPEARIQRVENKLQIK